MICTHVTHQNGQSPHLKYHSQLKAKEAKDVEGGESQLREATKKSTVNQGKVVIQV